MPAQTFLLKTANARARMKALWECACRILELGKTACVSVIAPRYSGLTPEISGPRSGSAWIDQLGGNQPNRGGRHES